jgi:hypothetical protein
MNATMVAVANAATARALPLQSVDDLRLLAGQLGAYLAQQCWPPTI